jgi:hypothetical protein
MPLLMVIVAPINLLVPIVSAASLGFLAVLGAVGAKAGGANILRATLRVTFWGLWPSVSPPGSASCSARLSDATLDALPNSNLLNGLSPQHSLCRHLPTF